MGSIWTIKENLYDYLTTMTGIKCGVAISSKTIDDILEKHHYCEEIVSAEMHEKVRLHSSECVEIFDLILYHLGRSESQFYVSKNAQADLKYCQDSDDWEKWSSINDIWNDLVMENYQIESKFSGNELSSKFLETATSQLGLEGLEMAKLLLEGFIEDQFRSVFHPGEPIDVTNPIELEDLFKKENLQVSNGKFFDQRFIDYLSRNPEKIGEIHWRQFEKLCAEFFHKEGFEVELGPGRSDGGIDIRIWPNDSKQEGPPLMIIQCKRQKEVVEQVIVKALYADVLHEKATSGMIITSSRLSPGAKQTCLARQYPIEQADRETVIQWLNQMKQPGVGIAVEPN